MTYCPAMLPILRAALPLSISSLFAIATAAFVVAGGQHALERSDDEPIGTGSSLGLSLAPRIERLGRFETVRPPIAFLGDSTVVAYDRGHKLPEALQHELDEIPRAAFVVNFASPGMGPLDFYAAATQLERTPIETAIVPVNLATFSDVWKGRWSRPEGMGWIPFDRIVEVVRLPVHWFGLTLDRFLFYQAIVSSGRASLWNRAQLVQARAGRALESARARTQPGTGPFASGMPRVPLTKFPGRWDRQGASGVQQVFGLALAGVAPDHPVIQMLRATVHEFESHEISTVAYIVPFNVEWVRSLGIYDERGVAATVHSIRTELEAEGAVVIDLHDLLPDSGFRDSGNHFTVNETIDGPALVAAQLAPVVAAQPPRRRPVRQRD